MESKNQKEKRHDVYQIITDRIIQQLEKGTVPWRQPWSGAGLPKNLVTKRPYRGINVWLLSSRGFFMNAFVTDKQLKELGAAPKKDEKPTPVVFWNWKEVKDDDGGEEKKVSFLRYYLVYNIEQCENLPEGIIGEQAERVNNPIQICEDVIESMLKKPLIKFREQKAFYNPLLDFVNMPKLKTFESSERYYETFFHELVHSTGHVTRLNRKELMNMEEFGGDAYSVEELIAEMGACFLKSWCGFDSTGYEQNAAYIQGWLSKLKNDKHFVIYAAGKSQRAVDWILDVPDEKEKGDDELNVNDEKALVS